ncbi:30S ribosome-binding factor RbfA [Mesomycoplasma molare]|uniref:Ribosome-binding factor A n=1 Tax=Mesomycoplasma molare TaxID=171288 RepID=A0ABY5TUN1_9BACT|nr:30S ribosome-binding factor RbfA [Mesomycoplasma molare]UWD34369.1 30S ribosome-binding factor RbfA [Mesomycoplasma molare]
MNKITLRKKESHYFLLVSKIIGEEITNSNVYGATVNDVKLSNDGSHLKIFLSFIKNSQKGLEAINNAKGYIRSQIAKTVNSRKVPELHFFLDEVFNSAQKIEEILKEIKKQKNQND